VKQTAEEWARWRESRRAENSSRPRRWIDKPSSASRINIRPAAAACFLVQKNEPAGRPSK
jgi:hypothetical protein